MARVAAPAARERACAAVLACLRSGHDLSAEYVPDRCHLTIKSYRVSPFATGQRWGVGNWRYRTVDWFTDMHAAVAAFVDAVGTTRALEAARAVARKHSFTLPGERPRVRGKRQAELF